VDNEYGGSYEYLAALKQLALDNHIDVPMFAKTQWPEEAQPTNLLLPLGGGYADGFWGGSTKADTSFSSSFLFSVLGQEGYPPLMVETGGGMTAAYHRRIWMHPADLGALATVAAGSGANLFGYYIFRGGTNPDGVLSTLEESQVSGYPNDLQVKNYDFFAPISQYGDLHPHFHLLRRLHLFVHSYQDYIATLRTTLPNVRPQGLSDFDTLRWSARSDGSGGLVFINNFQRNWNMSNTTSPLAAHAQVSLTLDRSASGLSTLTVPPEDASPAQIVVNAYTIWPFNFPVAPGLLRLAYSTCQIVTALPHYEAMRSLVVMAAVGSSSCEFAVTLTKVASCPRATCTCDAQRDLCFIRNIQISSVPAETVQVYALDNSLVTFIVVDEPTSKTIWRTDLNLVTPSTGYITPPGALAMTSPTSSFTGLLLESDPSHFRLRTPDSSSFLVLFPPPARVTVDDQEVAGNAYGLFTKYPLTLPANRAPLVSVNATLVRAGSTPPPVKIGRGGVAQAPDEDAQFGDQSVWQTFAQKYHVVVTEESVRSAAVRNSLRIRYTGDAARVYINGTLVQDSFYNGDHEFGLLLGLDRYRSTVFRFGFDLYILPLRRDAPIYLAGWPQFSSESFVELAAIDVLQTYDAEVVLA
jgi:beta-galactosidase